MTQLTLQITDNSKMEFLLELLKRMEFVEFVSCQTQESLVENENFDVEQFIEDIYTEREKSKQELSNKLDELF
ncbi:hypothetical protein ACE193_09460 [Bernardetia sp. OM2101]|uniref:hypothetical protein n=1 Tax=Bernardetia sp. OM2101 TaxID=3344876 RepID=UPI0035D03672